MSSDREESGLPTKRLARCRMPKALKRLVLVAIFGVPGLAQQFGEITGTATDASGAVIVGAVVESP